MLQSRKGFNQPRIVQAEQKKEEPRSETKKVQGTPTIREKNESKKEIESVAVLKAKQTTLKEQFAFVLYACAKETTRKYKLMLRDTGLTYTQYIAMLVLWDIDNINVKTLGEQLYLDSGTLTPMLHKMEKAGFIVRKRDFYDERNLIVSLTEKGKQMKNSMLEVEKAIRKELPVSRTEAQQLLVILSKILDKF